MDDRQDPGSRRATGTGRVARATLVGGAGLALVVGAAAASGATAPAVAVGGSGTTAELAVSTGWTFAGDLGRMGPGIGIGRFGSIEITRISGSSVSLETENGWTRTVTVTDAVTITKGGVEIELDALEVGDTIRLRETRDDDGTWSVTGIVVVVPMTAGTVTKVDAASITISERGGLTRVITTTGSTVYKVGGEDGSRSDVTVGDEVIVAGDSGDDGSFTATSVIVRLPRVAGEVTAKSGSSLTLQLRDGSTITVTVDADTEYVLPDVTDPGLDDIDVGDRVVVVGSETADGSVDAAAIHAGFGAGPGLGRGGHGRGPGGVGLDGVAPGGFGPGEGMGSGPWLGDDDDAAGSVAPDSTSS